MNKKITTCITITIMLVLTILGREDISISSNTKTVETNVKSVNCSYTTKIKKTKQKKFKASKNEIRYLSALVYAEAGIEPYNGKIAVANAVINRVRSKQYPSTIYKVIKQRGQFGPYWNGALRRELRNYDNGKYKRGSRKSAYTAVKKALSGTSVIGRRCSFNSASYEIRRPHKNALRIKGHLFW